MKSAYKTAMLAATALASGMGSVAAAQTPATPAAQEDVLAEIIVTAQKRGERLQDVPKSIDVVSGATAEKLALTNFKDIQQLSPGLSLESKEPSNNAITLRGVGFDPNSGAASTVDVYMNEVPINAQTAFKGLYDIGQIEVLRGPQGTLRGRTSPSGAITVTTRRPDMNGASGFIQQTVTDQDGYNTQAAIGAPIVEDKLAFRLAGLFDKNEGLGAKNLRNGSEDGDKTRSLRASLAFDPTDNLSIGLTHQYLINQTTANPILFTMPGQTTNPVLTADDRTSLTNGPTEYSFRSNVTTLTGELYLDDLQVSYVGGYQKIFNSRVSDLARGGSIPNYTQMQGFQSNARTVTQELRVSSSNDPFWNYIFGAYYDNSKVPTTVHQKQVIFGLGPVPAPPPAFGVIDINIDIPGKIENYAAFTDQRFQITEDDLFEVGLRYQEQKYNRRFIQTLSGPALGPFPIVQDGIAPANQQGKYKQVTGSSSWKHNFSKELMGYLSYGRSYRPGGITSTTAQLDEDLLLFKPEKSDSFEAGLKGTVFDQRFTYTIAAYQQNFNNYLAYTGSYLAVSTQRNGVVDNNHAPTFNADARVRGIEGTLSGELFDGLQTSLSVTYNDAQFKNALAPCNDFNGDGAPDSVGTPSVPVGQQMARCRLSGRLSAQAKWGLSTNFEYVRELSESHEGFVRSLLNYVPKRTDPFQNIRYNDLLNNSFFIGFRDADRTYEVSLFVKNIADTAALTTRSGAQVDYSTYNSGYEIGQPQPAREIGLIVRYSFN